MSIALLGSESHAPRVSQLSFEFALSMLLTPEVGAKLVAALVCLLESPAPATRQGPSRSDVQVHENPLTDCWPSHPEALCPISRPRSASAA
jgi:hypothetical protein